MLTTYFEFGEVYITPGVQSLLNVEEVAQLLAWHGQLKKGDLEKEDTEMNRRALRNGTRIFSAYSINGERFFVITEGSREYTTVLLPEEY